jgi:hypothetical protein
MELLSAIKQINRKSEPNLNPAVVTPKFCCGRPSTFCNLQKLRASHLVKFAKNKNLSAFGQLVDE